MFLNYVRENAKKMLFSLFCVSGVTAVRKTLIFSNW